MTWGRGKTLNGRHAGRGGRGWIQPYLHRLLNEMEKGSREKSKKKGSRQ